MFTNRDALWLSDTVHRVYRAQTAAELIQMTMDQLESRWSLNSCACEEFNRDASLYIMHDLRAHAGIPRDFAANLHDHPAIHLVQSNQAPSVIHLSAIITQTEWEKTDHYNGIARVAGYKDQLAMIIAAGKTRISISLFSDCRFDASDRLLAELIHSHLEVAWQRVKHRPDGQDGVESPRIECSSTLKPRSLSPRQVTLLRSYFPQWKDCFSLPEPLRDWAKDWLNRYNATATASQLKPFKVIAARGALFFRCFPGPFGTTADLFLVEVLNSPLTIEVGSTLTSRQIEIIRWIARGKRDKEIAAVLQIAPKTVSKHVEHILNKLGTETRMGCVAALRGKLDFPL